MDMPKPGVAHRKLEPLVGRVRGEETMHPSPWDPQPSRALGETEGRLALDGFAIVQDYTQETNGAVTFRGHGVFAHDAASDEYVMHWWDSMGLPACEFRGAFDGNVLQLDAKQAQHPSRLRYELGAQGYRFAMEVQAEGKWKPFIEAEYRRE